MRHDGRLKYSNLITMKLKDLKEIQEIPEIKLLELGDWLDVRYDK